MKPTLALRSFLLLTSSVFLAAHMAQAADLYWDSNGTTAGAGDTPTGTWGVDNFWNTDSTGGAGGAFQIPTLSTDDLFFSAGSDAVNPYSVSLNSATRNARRVTFQDGTATLTTGTLSLGTGGGITLTSGTVTGATISSGLTLSGNQTLNIAASRTLTLDTGTFTRNAGATLNVLSTGTVTTTMTGLSTGSLVNGIIGPWASHGTGASTRYATIDGSNNIVAYTGGTAAATAANVTSTLGTVNYDVAAVGTLGAGANINTLRYTGAAGTIAGALTTGGIMNVGAGQLIFSGGITTLAGGTVLHAANGGLKFTGGINLSGNHLTLTGSGGFNFDNTASIITGAGGITINGSGLVALAAGGTIPAHNYSGDTTISGGARVMYTNNLSANSNIVLNGGQLESYWTNAFSRTLGTGGNQIRIIGGESGFAMNGSNGQNVSLGASITWGDVNFNPSKLLLQNAASQGTSSLVFQSAINLNGAERTIIANAGVAGTATSTLGGALSGTGASGLIKEGSGTLILNVANSYAGNTTISAGTLRIAATDRLGSASNTLIFNGGTLQASGTVTSPSTRSVTMNSTGIIDSNNQTISIAGNISGAGGLTKNGNGTLTLSGTNNYGGVTTVNTGTLAITKEAALYNGAAGSWTAANLNAKSNTTLALNVDSAGSAGFSTSNLDTLLGNISVANTAAQGLQAGATLGLDTSTATGATFTPTSAITNSTGASGGSIGLNKLGAGTLVLNQANTFTGNTTVTNGTLQLGSGATAGSLSSGRINIGSGASFAVNQSDTVTQGTDFGALITGAGSMANVGSGTLVLNAPTFHTGNTTATAGNVTLNHALAIQNSALNATGAGTVTLGAGVTSPTFGGLANSGATRNLASLIDSSYANATNLTLNPLSGSSFTYGGVIADGAAGMTLTKTGAGTQILQGTNTYTGSTNISNGILSLSGTAGALAGTTGLTLNGGGLTLTSADTTAEDDFDRVNDSAAITSNGGTITYTTTTAGSTKAFIETLGSVTLGSGQLNLVNTLDKSAGSQTLALSGLTRTGATNTSAITFSNAGGLNLTNDRIRVNGITTDTAAGQIIGPWATVGTAANAQTDYAMYDSDGVNGFVVARNISGSAETTWTTAANAYTMSANQTLTGTRTITALRSATGAGGTLTLASGANLETYGLLSGSQTLAINIGTGGALTTPTGGGNLYITAGGNTITMTAPINDNGGAVTLVKSGSSTLTLGSAASNFSGGTVINAGTLTYSNDGQLGLAGTRNITFGGSATLTGYDTSSLGTITVNSGAVGTISANTITFATTTGSGIIRGTGGQNKTINLGNASTFTGDVALAYNANNNSGANTPHISFSRLNDAVGSSMQFYRQGGGTDSGQIGQIGLVGNASSLTFNNRQVQLLPRTGGTGQSMATNYLLNNNGSAANHWVINTNLLNRYDRDSTLGLGGNNTGANAFNGTIGNSVFAGTYTSGSGVLGVTKDQGGTWILGGANTYTGSTSITGGTLVVTSLANGGSASSIGASSNAASNLLLANATTLRYTGSGDSTNRGFTLNVGANNHGAILDASGTGAINFTNTASPSYATANQNRTLTLTGNNTGNNTLAAGLANNGTGVTTITKTGIGTWVLSGANVNTGATNISGGGNLTLDYGTQDNNKIAGILTLGSGAGDIRLRGGSHLEAVSSLTMGTLGGHTSITRDGGTAKLALGALTRTQNGYVTMSLAEDNLATTSSSVVNGILTGGITVGSNWAKVSSGNIVALAPGDYTALTAAGTTATVNYQLTGSLSRGSASINSLRIAGNGDDQVLTITSGNLTPSPLTGTMGNGAAGGILYAGGGNDNYTITGSGNIQAQNSNQELIIHAHTGTLTVDMALTMGIAGLTKSGAGTLALTKSGSYTGPTYVNQGTLRLRHATAAGTTAGGIVVANKGALELANSVAIGAEALTITGNGVSNGGALRNVASNTSSYAGAITIGNGGARINSDASGALTLTGGVVTSQFNNVTFGGAGNTTVQTAAISGAGGLTKDGAGTTSLTATNTYTGATNVDGGILAISGSGSINTTSAINVAAGASFVYNSSTALTIAPTLSGAGSNKATFSGSGAINAAMTLNSIDDVLSPGNSPGIQTFGISQTWTSFTYEWEVNNWAADVAGTNIDQIQITGALDLDGLAYALDVLSLTSGNVSGDVPGFTETTKSWTVLTTTGGITGFDPLEWTINDTGFTNAETGDWSLTQSGNNLVLHYTAIPEPSTALLVGLSSLLLFRRRRG